MVIGQRLSQLRDAALPGVEGLAGKQRLRRGPGNEIRGLLIALAGPQRDQAGLEATVVDDGDDAAFGGLDGAAAETIELVHGKLRLPLLAGPGFDRIHQGMIDPSIFLMQADAQNK